MTFLLIVTNLLSLFLGALFISLMVIAKRGDEDGRKSFERCENCLEQFRSRRQEGVGKMDGFGRQSPTFVLPNSLQGWKLSEREE